jgi:hypothetical protein
LEGAKKDLDKKKAEAGRPVSSGAPNKQQAQLSRGGRIANQITATNMLEKNQEKENLSKVLKSQQTISKYAAKPAEAGVGTFGMGVSSHPMQGKKIKLGEKTIEEHESAAQKIAVKKRPPVDAKKFAGKKELGLEETVIGGAGAAILGGLRFVANMGALAAAYKLVNNAPGLAAFYEGVGGFGGKFISGTVRSAADIYQRSKQTLESAAGRPMAGFGYDVQLLAQGKRVKGPINIAFAGLPAGENMGALAYDLQQHQDLLDITRDRAFLIKGTKAYGPRVQEWMINKVTDLRKEISAFFTKGR